MKTTFKSVSLIAISSIGLSTSSLAQKKVSESKMTISVETDPSTFALNGYAFHFRIKPRKSQRLVLGAGTYALDFPSLMVDMNSKNNNKDWNVRISSAYSLFGEYYFKEANQKWFVGLQAGIQNFSIKNESYPDAKNTFSNLLLMPSVGYNWQPFKFPIYIKPWMGIGYTSKIEGNNTIGLSEYNIAPVLPFMTLHVGYTFK